MVDLVPIWYKDRYCPPPPPPPPPPPLPPPHTGHVKIKVTDLEFSRNNMCNIRRAILSGDRSCYFFIFFCSVLTVVILLKSAHGECPKNYISQSDGNRRVCCVPAYNCELGKLTSLLYSLFPVDCILHCLPLIQDFFSGLYTSAGNKIDFFQILA